MDYEKQVSIITGIHRLEIQQEVIIKTLIEMKEILKVLPDIMITLHKQK